MGNVLPLPGELEQDKRTVKEWTEDQGLEYVVKPPAAKKAQAGKTPTVKDISWVNSWDVSVTKSCITLSKYSTVTLDADWVFIGIGTLDGETVLLIRPATDGLNRAYRVRVKGTSRSIANPHLMKLLTERGLALGKYRLLKTPKGDLIARPIKT